MKTLKKLLSLLLCLALVLSFFPAAYAEGEEPADGQQEEESGEIAGTIAPVTEEEEPEGILTPASEDEAGEPIPMERTVGSFTAEDPNAALTWQYDLTDAGNAVLTGFSGDLPSSLQIPSSLDGHTVTEINGNLFQDHTELTSIQIPDTIIIIRDWVFANTGLTTLTLPEGLQELGCGILFGNTGVKSITIPSTLEETATGTTYISPGEYQDDIYTDYGPLGGSAIETLTVAAGTESVKHHLAAGALQLKTVNLPDSVKYIHFHAFMNCIRLTKVQMPSSLLEIEHNAFEGCKALTSLEIPGTVKKIQDWAFANTGLTSLTLPEGLQELGCGILFGNTGVKSITIPSTLEETATGTTYISPGEYQDDIYTDYGPLGGSAIETLTVAAGTESVKHHLAAGALQLKTVNLPDSVKFIHFHAFMNCIRLTKVQMPSGLLEIEHNAFEGCKALTSLEIPGTVKKIYDWAFAYTGLTSLTLPEGLQYLECGILYGNTAVKSITIPSTLQDTSTGTGYFRPSEYEDEIYSTYGPLGGSAIETLTVANGTRDLAHHVAAGAVHLKTVYLPEGLEWLRDGVFENCVALTEIELPETVKYLGSYSLRGCKALTSMELPAALLEIHDHAFDECKALTGLEIPGSVKKVLDWAFANSGLTSLMLAEGLEELGCGILFGNTGVKSITIPSTLQETSTGTGPISPGEYQDDIYTTYGPLGGSAVETLTVAEGTTELVHHIAAGALHLKTAFLPEGIERFQDGTFENCVALKEIKLPETVKYLQRYSLKGCTALTSIELPAALLEIQDHVFAEWTEQSEFWFNGNAPTIEENAFEATTGTAYYPGENSTWTSDVMQNYGGDITWLATYDVRFDANGGTGAPEKQRKVEETELTLSTVKPTRANESAGSYTVTLNANGGSVSTTKLTAARTTSYTFKNWNTAANGSGTSYAAGAAYTTDASVTLYAQWNSTTTTAAVTLPTPSRTGYSFKGWGTSATATSGRTGSYTPTGNVTLYAVWEPNRYTVSYDANGGVGEPANQEKIHDVTLTLSTVKPTRESEAAGSYTVTLDANGGSVNTGSLKSALTTNFTFKNWNTAANGSGTTYASGGSYTGNAALTLYAQWNSDISAAAVTLPTPTREGYSFKGWATSATATSGTVGSYTPSGNVTLYAIWSANQYVVTYDANGGTGAPEAQDKTHDVTLKLSTVKPTRASASAGNYTVTLDANGGSVSSTSLKAERTTSYSFQNWNTSANGSGTSYASGANYTANASVTLYAQWNSSTSTAAVTLPTPTRDGYSFLGWGSSATATEGVTGSYTPAGNVTLYAIWEKLPDSSIQVGEVTGMPGSEILVPVSVVGELDVYAFSFHVNYDNTVLKFLGVEEGSLSGWGCNLDAGYLHWFTSVDADQHAAGVIVNLRFQILETAPDGTTPITVDDLDVVNRDEVEFSLAALPGSVTVSSRIAGDVNDDGSVDIRDLVRLRRHLLHEPVSINLENADVTGDGEVTNTDLVRLRRFLVGDPKAVLN